MAYTTIDYCGARLDIPLWLVEEWPYHLPLDSWPSFCGAGEGIGDWLVPESLYGACISPACFIHDIDFACSPRTFPAFAAHNNRLARNAKALVDVQISGPDRALATAGVARYWFFCMAFGWRHFDPESQDHLQNKTVRDRLNRLAKATLLR